MAAMLMQARMALCHLHSTVRGVLEDCGPLQLAKLSFPGEPLWRVIKFHFYLTLSRQIVPSNEAEAKYLNTIFVLFC